MIQWQLYCHGTTQSCTADCSWDLMQPWWSALTKNVIWSFVFRITAIFPSLFSCGEFGRGVRKAFCQDRAGSLLHGVMGRLCSQPSHAQHETDVQSPPLCDPEHMQEGRSWSPSSNTGWPWWYSSLSKGFLRCLWASDIALQNQIQLTLTLEHWWVLKNDGHHLYSLYV